MESMESFPETEHYDRGFKDGLKYGREIGYEDMLKEGKLHGADLGNLLGQIYTDLGHLLNKLNDEKKRKQVELLMQQVLEYPLDNEVDASKEERLESIKKKHKEYALIYGMELVDITKKNLDF
jgi:hypothetical protein